MPCMSIFDEENKRSSQGHVWPIKFLTGEHVQRMRSRLVRHTINIYIIRDHGSGLYVGMRVVEMF